MSTPRALPIARAFTARIVCVVFTTRRTRMLRADRNPVVATRRARRTDRSCRHLHIVFARPRTAARCGAEISVAIVSVERR